MSGIEPGGEVDVALMELLDAPNAGAARAAVRGGLDEWFRATRFWLHVMGCKPLNPAGPMTATERSKRRYALKSKFINQRRRRLRKEAKEAKERRHTGWPDDGLVSQ